MEHLKVVSASSYEYLLVRILEVPDGYRLSLFDKKRDTVVMHKATLTTEDEAEADAKALVLDYLHHQGEHVPAAAEVTFDWSPQD